MMRRSCGPRNLSRMRSSTFSARTSRRRVGLASTADQRLCERIKALGEARACTLGCSLSGKSSPAEYPPAWSGDTFTSDVQERIVKNSAAASVTCTAEHHLGLATTPPSPRSMNGTWRIWSGGCGRRVRAYCLVCHRRAGCTRGGPLEAGRHPVYNSPSPPLSRRACELAGVEDSRVEGSGSLFTDDRSARSKVGNSSTGRRRSAQSFGREHRIGNEHDTARASPRPPRHKGVRATSLGDLEVFAEVVDAGA